MGTKGTISQDLSDLLTTKNFDPVYTDGTGRDSSPAEAVVFSFDYVAGSGKNYGTAVAVLGDQNDLQFFFGDNLGKSIDNPADKNDWFQFLEQLSNFATQHRYTFSPKDINQLKHTMAGIAAIKEGLFEGYYGTRKVSYMGEATEARLVIKHKKALEENDRRHLYVESLFIETADGERFKLPFRKLTGGRAMLEHVRQGGKPYDIRGCHIAEMVNEINLLARFNRASHGRVFEGNTAQLVESAQAYYHTLQENLKHLASNRGYQVYFESWTPADIDAGDALVEDIKTLFVEQSIDARIEAALPTLLKIQQQEQVMKEAQIFENWINHLAEGTWALPDTPEQEAKLKELMSQELIAGPDGANATEQLYDLVGDDQLFDLIGAAAEADPNVNIWDVPEVVDRLQELGVEVPVNQEADEQTPQAVSESHMSEVDSIIQDLISGEADAYNLLTSPTTPEEQYVSNILRKEYEDVSIDHGLHPDDDFEEIIDRVLDRLAQDYGHNVTEADSPYFAETTVAGSVAPVAHEMAEESEKNPFTNALGHALWRDLSKEKKASPQQVQRNKERWAKRQAEREQGVAEEAENKDMTGQTCEKCKRGKYQETSIHDDMDGVLHCTKCGTKVDRWRAYKEPSARARSRQATKDFNRSKSQGMAEGSTDTVYPNAEVIKSKNGKPIGEIYKDEYGWGCFHYGADRGYDLIDSRKDAIDALRDLHQEAGHKGPDYTIKGVAEGYDDEEHPIRDDGNEGRPGKQYQCPRCHSTDIKTYSDGEKECHQCHKTWDVKGVAETTRGGFGGSAGQAHHEIEWLKNKIETLKPLLAKKPSIARQIKDLERQIRERELAIAYQKEGMAEGEQQAFVNPHHNDPINANSAITGSYYEGEDPLVRLKSLALSK